MDNIILIVLIAALLSTIMNVFFKKMNMPPIIGYILAGVFIASLFDLQNSNKQMLAEVAEFGIVFLLFTIGLEFSIEHLRRMKKEVLLHGTMQFMITSAVFYAIAHYGFSISPQGAIITGSALALSSTAIVLKFFHEKREMGREYARQSLGILIFQDIAVIPILIMIGIFTQTSQTSVMNALVQTTIHAAVVLAVLFIFGKYVLNRVFAWVTASHSHEIFISFVLMLVVGASYLAHSFGFSYSLGAFLAGLMIAETHYKYQVEADLTPFRDILLGVFFVSVGMQIHPPFLFNNLSDILMIMSVVMVVKAVIIFLILRISHWTSTSLKTALTLSQVGEFSFVIFELGIHNNLVDAYFAKEMIIAVIFSLIITPFMLRYMEQAFRVMRREASSEPPLDIAAIEKMSDHIIVCGYGFHGRQVVNQLERMNIPYLAIEFQRSLVEEAVKSGKNVMFGNAAQKSILKKAGVDVAMAAIVAIDDEPRAALVGRRLAEASEDINIVVKVSHEKLFENLQLLPTVHIINEHKEIAKTLVNYAITCDIDRSFG